MSDQGLREVVWALRAISESLSQLAADVHEIRQAAVLQTDSLKSLARVLEPSQAAVQVSNYAAPVTVPEELSWVNQGDAKYAESASSWEYEIVRKFRASYATTCLLCEKPVRVNYLVAKVQRSDNPMLPVTGVVGPCCTKLLSEAQQ